MIFTDDSCYNDVFLFCDEVKLLKGKKDQNSLKHLTKIEKRFFSLRGEKLM